MKFLLIPDSFKGTLSSEQICRLLEEKDLSVTEIALRCGFQSIRTFNEVFLEKTGATPSAFRKGIWKNNCFPGLIVKKM